ncbi:MAG: hypothetical protein EBX49_10145 [Synechococcaceae bacterium WB8_1B_136]|nr:hypothetical protein [Synechococcaceae bacterium WB8_1B_136]
MLSHKPRSRFHSRRCRNSGLVEDAGTVVDNLGSIVAGHGTEQRLPLQVGEELVVVVGRPAVEGLLQLGC